MEIRASAVGDFEAINRFFNQEAEGGLSERGRREAAEVADYFRRKPVDAVYASPMTRALQTATYTAEALDLEVGVLDEVRELRTGRLPDSSLAARWLRAVNRAPLLPERAKRLALGATLIPLYYQQWRRGRTEGGESRRELEERIAAAFDRVRRAHADNARVALFAHGYLIFYMSVALVRPPLSRFQALRRPYIPNGSITQMELPETGPPRLLSYAQPVG
jgi:probable phosphoglycerate mutase